MKTRKLLLTLLSLLNLTAFSQTFEWAIQMGGANSALGNSITTDASGNVYTAGVFCGTADFDPGPGTANLTAAGGYDIFVQKLDASGGFLWAKQMGGTGFDEGRSITVDASGNVYTTGVFTVTADFKPGAGTTNLTSAGGRDIFVQAMDASGNFLWAKQMGGTDEDRGYSITADASGNIHTTGRFQGTADFDPGTGITNLICTGDYDIFVQKMDASGNFLWAKQMGGTDWDLGYCIAIDASGNVYTTGYFHGTADFYPGVGTVNLTSAGGRDIFIQKLDASGNFLWAKQMGGTGFEEGLSITVDGSGNVYTTGQFNGTADFDPGVGTVSLTSAGGTSDIFVQKLDASGNFIWAKQMGGATAALAFSVTVDAIGNVYTTGEFTNTADFDPGAGTANLSSAGDGDIFVQKMDASGNFLWAKQMGGAIWQEGYDITVDASGNVYTTGYFNVTTDFDPGPGTANLTSAGQRDMFVQKMSQCVVDISVTQTGSTLTAGAFGASYQWLDCANKNSKISRETNQSFTATANGSYAVIVTIDACSDTSSCHAVPTIWIGETDFGSGISVYPNRVADLLIIDLPSGTRSGTIELINIFGQIVYRMEPANSRRIQLDISSLSSGFYFVKIHSMDNIAAFRVIKQ